MASKLNKEGFFPKLVNWFRKSFSQIGSGGGVYGLATPWWSGWSYSGRLPGSTFDYRSEAGLLWQNSIVYAGLNFIATAFNEADIRVEVKRKGRWIPVDDHKIVQLLEHPNPYYNGEILWSTTILSLECAGNAYWFIERDDLGRIIELWYIPHWMIRPVWDQAGKHFIMYYAYYINGKIEKIPCDNIVHLRGKFLDPLNPRMGISSLDAALREIVTDNEAATFMSAVLRNGGFPGLVVTPKDNDVEEFTTQQREELKQQFNENFTGDGRGSTLVQSIPIDIHTPGYTPEELVLEKVRGISEERVCACLELPPVVVHMGSGLSKTTAKASHKESKRQAYDSKIIPMQKSIAAQVTLQLMKYYESDSGKYRLGWDWSNVLVLQDDLNEKAKRYNLACGGPWLTVNEIRELESYDPIEDGDKIRTSPALEEQDQEYNPTDKEKDENRDEHDD